MKIVVAPDSFKDSVSSREVCDIVFQGIREVMPEATVVRVPMGDGGEGTVDAVVAATGGTIETVEVCGPLCDRVPGRIGFLPDATGAIIEMASASGIELLPVTLRNPLLTTTRGTGELILAAMDRGVRQITLGIGGSATTDGGVGMATALGYRFLDEKGEDIGPGGGQLTRLAQIDSTKVDPRLRDSQIQVACEVTNPLLGERGAARVFGPQKGATPLMVEMLEDGLTRLAALMIEMGLVQNVDCQGDGAAGGLGLGLRGFCGARMVSGAGWIAEKVGLGDHLQGADLLITGEGRTDSQTISGGKLCAVVASMAAEKKVPSILISGALEGDMEALFEVFDAVYSICPGVISLDAAISSTRANLLFSVRSVMKTLRLWQRDRAG